MILSPHKQRKEFLGARPSWDGRTPSCSCSFAFPVKFIPPYADTTSRNIETTPKPLSQVSLIAFKTMSTAAHHQSTQPLNKAQELRPIRNPGAGVSLEVSSCDDHPAVPGLEEMDIETESEGTDDGAVW
jgi:hypothetical protein